MVTRDGPPADEEVGAVRRPPRPWPPDEGVGEVLVRVDVWATVVFAVTSAGGRGRPRPAASSWRCRSTSCCSRSGCAAFLWAYAVAIGRSRYDDLTMAGVFFLADRVAPARVTRSFRVLLAVQVVVAVATAAVRPFTALAFGVLVPVFGLGLMALWGARHGAFRPALDAVRPGVTRRDRRTPRRALTFVRPFHRGQGARRDG